MRAKGLEPGHRPSPASLSAGSRCRGKVLWALLGSGAPLSARGGQGILNIGTVRLHPSFHKEGRRVTADWVPWGRRERGSPGCG